MPPAPPPELVVDAGPSLGKLDELTTVAGPSAGKLEELTMVVDGPSCGKPPTPELAAALVPLDSPQANPTSPTPPSTIT
jgi:hypothetical protein